MTESSADARLTELEIKLSFAEEQIEALNDTLYRQQRQIDAVLLELRALRTQVAEGKPNEPRSLRDDLPPHY
jgi:SlyX protein